MTKENTYLKVEDLKPYYTYRIKARNGRVGVWRPDKGDFILRRTKFHDTFAFGEIHWDLDKSFGTVKPLEELEKSPFNKEDLESKVWKWQDTGLDKPDWATGDEVWFNPKEEDVLNYLKGWEDKMDDPHPREPYNGKN